MCACMSCLSTLSAGCMWVLFAVHGNVWWYARAMLGSGWWQKCIGHFPSHAPEWRALSHLLSVLISSQVHHCTVPKLACTHVNVAIQVCADVLWICLWACVLHIDWSWQLYWDGWGPGYRILLQPLWQHQLIGRLSGIDPVHVWVYVPMVWNSVWVLELEKQIFPILHSFPSRKGFTHFITGPSMLRR